MYYNKLKNIRQEKGMTLDELSAKSGVSSGYLCHLERGSRTHPSVEIMEKIAKALNMSVEDLIEMGEWLNAISYWICKR